MIFVTVGTHEQQFHRLVDHMDDWAGEHDEKVIIQSGFTPIEPKNCKVQDFFSRDEMGRLISEARIVITHGGPCCYTEVLASAKIPVVVPRSHKLAEQVDDHQIEIGREFKNRYNNIILVEDIGQLDDVISRYDEIIKDMDINSFMSHNDTFCEGLSKIVDGLFK